MPKSSDLLRQRLRKLRLKAGLTQEALAERCGMPYKVYQHLERGRRSNPRLSTLEKLAEGLGVELRDLFEPSI